MANATAIPKSAKAMNATKSNLCCTSDHPTFDGYIKRSEEARARYAGGQFAAQHRA